MNFYKKRKQKKKEEDHEASKDEQLATKTREVQEFQEVERTLKQDLALEQARTRRERWETESLTMRCTLQESKIDYLQQQLSERGRTDVPGVGRFLEESERTRTQVEEDVQLAIGERERAVEDSVQRLRQSEQMQMLTRQEIEHLKQENNSLREDNEEAIRTLYQSLQKEDEQRITVAEMSCRILEVESRNSELAERLEAQASALAILNAQREASEKAHEEDTEALASARLTLNQTRNQLDNEKRQVAQCRQEVMVKSQRLEFVQQQCLRMQEQLAASRNTRGRQPSRSGIDSANNSTPKVGGAVGAQCASQ